MLRPRTRERSVDNGGDEGDKNSLGDDLDADGEKDEGEDEEKDGEDPGAGADDSSETGEASVDDSTFGILPRNQDSEKSSLDSSLYFTRRDLTRRAFCSIFESALARPQFS
ncbi:hypothetical protein PC117_g6444 [Phytophthora cactorum]|uniref:Uncharacterized protein n=1 Tax=Phytophthora cactorum TaxID=29920 RepID=A0A8T1E4L9_9STRA|nr:hypothetical protein PC117_g6444 [Phytophthora cactorum]